jgi:iron complex transport system substrate-binding protein
MKHLLLIVVLLSALLSMVPAQAQSTGAVVVIALESAREPVQAWAEVFGHADLQLEFVASDDEMMARLADADVMITTNYEEEPPIEFECGIISDVYMLLPGLGARYLASLSCGGELDPHDAIARDFLEFVVSPDGQQVAIDLGELPQEVEITDQAGMTVRVPQPVRRIASPYSLSTYYVYTLGAGDRLVAAGYLGARDPEGQEVMRRIDPNFDQVANAVSSLNQQEANLEELAALEPDLILASSRTDWLDAAGELGLPIIRFEGESPEKLQEAMTLLGAILGPDAAYHAETFNAYYATMLDTIRAQTQAVADPVKVYFSGTEPLRVASGAMYQTRMVEAAGAVSVSHELPGFWNDVNLEQVLIWNPDVIIFPPYGGITVEAFTDATEWAVVPAVQQGHVYRMPKLAAPWDTPVPDSILGIIWLAETLYPDQVAVDCRTEAARFYRAFYGYSTTPEELERLCS